MASKLVRDGVYLNELHRFTSDGANEWASLCGRYPFEVDWEGKAPKCKACQRRDKAIRALPPL